MIPFDPLAYLHEAGLSFYPRAGVDYDGGIRLEIGAFPGSIPVVDATTNQFTGGMLQYLPPGMNNADVVAIASAEHGLVMPDFFNFGMVGATSLETAQIRGDLWME